MPDYGFWNFAKRSPDACVLVETSSGRKTSAGELAAGSYRLVNALRGLGLDSGDAFSVVLPNSREIIEAYLAAFQVGMYLVPINHHLTAPEIAYIARDSGSKVLIGHEGFSDELEAVGTETGLSAERLLAVGSIPGFSSYADALAGASTDEPGGRTAGQVMNYTSGTTGLPKGVRRKLPGIDPDEAGALYAMFLSMFGIQPEDGNVHLCGSPLYHTAVMMFTSGSLHYGHKVALMDKWKPEDCLRVIEEERVTTSHMVPTQLHRMLGLSEEVRGKYDMSSLRTMIHAAAPCPVEIKQRMMKWWGPVVYEYYAASEGGGTLVTPEEWLERPGTVGKAWPTSDIRIIEEDTGKQCDADEPGTVYMLLGSNDFKYHNDDKKTDDNRREGYFTVGDIGYLDDAGYLFLCDRKADMIISGGVNIYPAEIESVLLTHPAVADAAVFGIPHEDWGEEVKAVVQPGDGHKAGDPLIDDINSFCEHKLAKYKRPRTIDFIEEMPRDPNGKLYKRKLRDPYWEGQDRAI